MAAEGDPVREHALRLSEEGLDRLLGRDDGTERRVGEVIPFARVITSGWMP